MEKIYRGNKNINVEEKRETPQNNHGTINFER